MNDAVRHRGPDDQGVFFDEAGRVALGHRRLSIIDLSPAGRQPMSYRDGRYWTVYNGEIYNYRGLRNELEKNGHVFNSNTDTEVLLAAYAEWGQDCLRKLRGMFAFAIYDRQSAEVFLARDRFGIKPLYFFQQGGMFLFASEIKALLASGHVSRHVDPQSIWDYLSLGSIPQPRTILSEVQALLPGHAVVINAKLEVKIFRYWDILEASYESREATRRTLAPQETASELRQKLDEATRLHMIADVPVGAFLSGGIDSTAVVGLMSQYVSRPIKTYSVGFESRHARLNEFQWAKMASERFGTEHTEVMVTGKDVADGYDSLVQAIDQPSSDGTNAYFVAKATRLGVTVSLSGQGGDELLAGYPHFSSLLQASNRDRRFPAWLRGLYGFLPGRYFPEKPFIASRLPDRYALLRNLADESVKRRMIAPVFRDSFRPKPLTEMYQPLINVSQDSVALTSYIEIKSYLANTLLRDGDAMSMAHSLEVRPLLLDHVVAEYIFALPPCMKINENGSKRILIDALHDLIPDPIVQRRKMGFEMPLFEWLVGPLKERALAAFSSSIAQRIFSEPFLAEAKSKIREPMRADRRLWGYMMLIEWLNAYRCTC